MTDGPRPRPGGSQRGPQPDPTRRPAPGVGPLRENIRSGFGNPEGEQYAGHGVIWQDTDPATGGKVYRKSTPSGNTGWVELGGGAVGDGITRLLTADFTTPEGNGGGGTYETAAGYGGDPGIPWFGDPWAKLGPGDDSDLFKFYFNEIGWWQASLKVIGVSSSSSGVTAQPGLWCWARIELDSGSEIGDNGHWYEENPADRDPNTSVYQMVVTTPPFYVPIAGVGDGAPFIRAQTGFKADGAWLGAPTGNTGDLTLQGDSTANGDPHPGACRFDIRRLG